MAVGTKQNLTIKQGTTYRFDFYFVNDDDTVPDLSNHTARLQIRATVDGATTLVDLTTENNGISINGVLGKVSLLISSAATAAFTWTKGVYDLELIDQSGEVSSPVYGGVVVQKEVTR